jgi:hypothetical protein
MWCPVDCVHFHEVCENCESAAWRILPLADSQLDQKECVFAPDSGQLDHQKSRQSQRNVIENSIMQHFLERHRYNALAASKDGQIVRLSPNIMRPVLYNPQQEVKPPHTDHMEFLYVDVSSGLIDPAASAARMARAFSMYFDGRDTNVLTREELDSREERKPENHLYWQDSALKEFGYLSGWAVCYKRDEVQFSVDYLVGLWRDYQKKWKSGDKATISVGRPRQQEEVAMAYRAKFPNGHKGSWKDALMAIQPQLSQPVSIDTLMRSLGKKS